MSSSGSDAPFTQLVQVIAKDQSSRDQLVKAWVPAAEFTTKAERGTITLSYEVFVPDASKASQPNVTTEVAALETYASKQQLEELHVPSPAIQAFLKTATELAEVRLTYLRPRVGFHTRGEAREAEVRAAGTKPIALFVTVDFDDNAKLEAFLKHAEAQAAAVQANEPGCLTYMFTSALTKPDEPLSSATRVLIYERYVNAAAIGEHVQKESFKAFSAATAGDPAAQSVKPMEINFYHEQAVGFWGRA